MSSGVAKQHRSLISLSDIDQAFNNSVIKELAHILKIHKNAHSRLTHNLRNDARLFIDAKARLNIPGLRQEIARLYGLTLRASVDGKVTRQLARGVDDMHVDLRDWLVRCNPKDRNIPTSAEILSRATHDDAVNQLRLILSFGGRERKGRKRPPTGERSRSPEPLLRVPGYIKHQDECIDAEIAKANEITGQAYVAEAGVGSGDEHTSSKRNLEGRPQGKAERDFVQNLALTYTELTGKQTPDTASLQTPGPFVKFVRRCFERVGAPTGNVIRLINQRGDARRALTGRNIDYLDYPKDFSAYLDKKDRFGKMRRKERI